MLLSHTVKGCALSCIAYLKFAAPGILKHPSATRSKVDLYSRMGREVRSPNERAIGRQKDFRNFSRAAVSWRLDSFYSFNLIRDTDVPGLQFRMRSARSCIVCDHINLHTNSRSFLHLVHLSTLSRSLLFASLSLPSPISFFRFFTRSPFSAGWVRFSFLFPFLSSTRHRLFCSHFRTPANSHEPPVVPIKSIGIVFKLVRAFYLYVRSSLPCRFLDRSSGRFVAH